MDKERIFWQAIRRALLAIVAAIDERYSLGRPARQQPPRQPTTTASEAAPIT